MSKFTDFMASLFLPRKMVKFKNMNFFIALLLFLCATFFNVTTGNIHCNDQAEEKLGFPSFYEKLPDDMKMELPEISVQYEDNLEIEIYEDDKLVTKKVSGKYIKSDQDGTFHKVFSVDDKKLDVTIVIESKKPTTFGTIPHPVEFEHFDFEGYVKQEKKADTDYVLYVLAMDQVYYLYNLELDDKGVSKKPSSFVYETTKDDPNEFQFYLPASKDELKLNEYGDFDTRLWTRKAAKDDQIDFTFDSSEFGGLFEVKPVNRHQKNILHSLWGGQYGFSNLDEAKVDITELNKSLKNFLINTKEGFIISDGALLKTLNVLKSIASTIIFPLIFCLICWLMSKSFVMKKFKNYYNIASLTYFHASLVALILGSFLNYEAYALAILILGTIYFLVATIRINTMQDTPADKDQNQKTSQPKKPIEYKKVESDASRIG